MTSIGVLALQGDFAEHVQMLERLGADAFEIRWSHELSAVEGLIIPGGESTTIARLTGDAVDPIFSAIHACAARGMPIYGTCMGSIFLAKNIEGSTQGRLALMDITVRRNAFGPQKFSFERLISIPALGDAPFPAIFIRGPLIVETGPQVAVLARLEEGIVMARQDNLLVTSFHPEITADSRVHEYFLGMVDRWVSARRRRLATASSPAPQAYTLTSL